MVSLKILQGLSCIGAENLIIEEGYICQETIERQSEEYDAIYIYPYYLLSDTGRVIDKIYFVEYCIAADDEEFDVIKCLWTRDTV